MKDLAIALSAFDSEQQIPVERDASGIPVAWRIVAYGPWTVTKNGETFVLLDVTEAIIDQVIAYYAKKGVKVPIDSRHFLYQLAEKYGVDESEIIRLMMDEFIEGINLDRKNRKTIELRQDSRSRLKIELKGCNNASHRFGGKEVNGLNYTL